MPQLHSLTTCRKDCDPDRNRAFNFLMRSQTPYPFGHEAIFRPQPKLNLLTTITNDNGDTFLIIFLLFL